MKAIQALQLPIHHVHARLMAREFTAVQLTEASFNRIDYLDPDLNAFISLTREQALSDARQADGRLVSGQGVTALTGIPVAIKDNIDMKGVPTTCASQLLAKNMAVEDALVVQRLKAAGAVIVGKTNMDELAMGSWSLTSANGPISNPWDLERLPGGSSGGSAAAVAASMVFGALGSDTGGSIRQPAALCGIVGLRPTHGLIGSRGLFPSVDSLDTIGPLARNVTDAALILNALLGTATDPTGRWKPMEIPRLKIGLPTQFFDTPIESETRRAIEAALMVFETDLEAEIHEVGLPHLDSALVTYRIFTDTAAYQGLAHFLGPEQKGSSDQRPISQKFGDEVLRRISDGKTLLNALEMAWENRNALRADFKRLFDTGINLIVGPTAPMPAIRWDDELEPDQDRLSDLLTFPTALAGLPGLSVPCGFTQARLPIGLQLIGPALGEQLIMSAAYAYAQRTDWHRQRPPL